MSPSVADPTTPQTITPPHQKPTIIPAGAVTEAGSPASVSDLPPKAAPKQTSMAKGGDGETVFDFSGDSSSKGGMTKDEEEQRNKETLACAFRVFAKWDLGHGVVGHLTCRSVHDPHSFWVNPFQTAFALMTASDLLLIRPDGTVAEGTGKPGRRIYNQAAFAIHSAIHHARPDVFAACHSHSVYGSAFASFGKLPDMISQDSCFFYEDLALYPSFGGVVVAEEEAKNVCRYLGGKKAMIMQNHGLLTTGGSIEAAASWFLMLEKVCQMQLLVDAAANKSEGREQKLIGHDEAKFTVDQIGGEASGKFMFGPYRDIIDAETNGSYKK